jgi:hypothetical protein
VLERLVRMVACIALTLLAAAPLAAQSGTLQGTVSDSAGAALDNASVTVDGTGLRTTTRAGGGYELRGVPRASIPCGCGWSATARRTPG